MELNDIFDNLFITPEEEFTISNINTSKDTGMRAKFIEDHLEKLAINLLILTKWESDFYMKIKATKQRRILTHKEYNKLKEIAEKY